MRGRAARRNARREELGVHKHAADQMRHPREVGPCVHICFLPRYGVSVTSPGAPVIGRIGLAAPWSVTDIRCGRKVELA
jgi:hypothetical protein